MSLFRSFGWVEGMFVGLFILAYGLYLIRIVRISRSLHTPYGTVFIKLALRTVVVSLILISILGPTFGDAKREIKSVGKDIMFCVDLSKSMDAFDVPPTRLEKIKFEMKKVVAAFNSDRLGVIIFSSEAFMQCPLTYDQNALNLFIETMNTNLVPGSGTDFGPPLKMALAKLEEQEGQGREKSKVIVLISDGEDFGDDTKEMMQQVEDQGIRLFTLGVGTERGSQIVTNRGGYKTDQQGNAVVTKLNARSLKELASKTDGQYFEINESRNDVNKLINAINKIEGQVRDARVVDVSANRYFYFLVAALVLLVLDVLVSVRTVKI